MTTYRHHLEEISFFKIALKISWKHSIAGDSRFRKRLFYETVTSWDLVGVNIFTWFLFNISEFDFNCLIYSTFPLHKPYMNSILQQIFIYRPLLCNVCPRTPINILNILYFGNATLHIFSAASLSLRINERSRSPPTYGETHLIP